MSKLTASSGDIRPSGTTLVASMQTAPTPRVAKPCFVGETSVSEIDIHTEVHTCPDVNEMPVGSMAIGRACGALRKNAKTIVFGITCIGTSETTF